MHTYTRFWVGLGRKRRGCPGILVICSFPPCSFVVLYRYRVHRPPVVHPDCIKGGRGRTPTSNTRSQIPMSPTSLPLSSFLPSTSLLQKACSSIHQSMSFSCSSPTMQLAPQPKPPRKRYPCDEPGCTITFSRSSDAARHKVLHQQDPEMFSCDKCSYKSIQKINCIRHHQRMHEKVVQAVCYACETPKTFCDSSGFGHHCTRVHKHKAAVVREYNRYWLRCTEGPKAATVPMPFENYLQVGFGPAVPVPVSKARKRTAATTSRQERRDAGCPYARERAPKVEEGEDVDVNGLLHIPNLSRALSEAFSSTDSSRSVYTPFEETLKVEPAVYDPVEALMQDDFHAFVASLTLPRPNIPADSTTSPPLPSCTLPSYMDCFGGYAQTADRGFAGPSYDLGNFGYWQKQTYGEQALCVPRVQVDFSDVAPSPYTSVSDSEASYNGGQLDTFYSPVDPAQTYANYTHHTFVQAEVCPS
ncbi:hypothetical protein OF83DRAFT_537021 [Amylostereum chailletii]|nr:hypothetical protein OF83DRAFT_537021 [Amylostereum chailletii]